jgi:hypothetical protein
MATITLEELYEQHIRPLSVAERLRLLAMVADDLVQLVPESDKKPKRNIMELGGLGAEIWKGVDAQEYVNELRSEWNDRP